MISNKEIAAAVRERMPDLFKADSDARESVDIIFGCIPRALENADTVDLPGIGQISAEHDHATARKKVEFKAL